MDMISPGFVLGFVYIDWPIASLLKMKAVSFYKGILIGARA